jgi:hypothetical protein
LAIAAIIFASCILYLTTFSQGDAMPLTLSDQDLAEFNVFLMRNCRGDEIAAVQQWIGARQQRQAQQQKVGEAVRAETAKAANGHDANPYTEQSTAAH